MPTLVAQVDSGIRLVRAAVPIEIQARLHRALCFRNPAYVNLLRLGRSTQGVPDCLHFLEEDGDELRLPRGAVHLLKQCAAQEGYSVVFDDRRVLPEERLPELPEPLLRPYQERAVRQMVRSIQGTVVGPCGCGKGRLGVATIARLRTPTLVLVHTLDLAEQWRREIKQLLGLDTGLIGHGTVTTGPVTIALVQSLFRREQPWLERLLAQFGLLLIEEMHHVGSRTFYEIVDRCPAKYRFGLTATPEREDGLTPLLELFVGRRVAEVTHDELISAGVLKLPEVRAIETGFSFSYMRPEDYPRMTDALVGDTKRNALIADCVATEAGAGHSCLVLSGRIDHCKELCALIRQRGIQSELLVGPVKKERRTELLAGARAGEIPVLVATTLADEGLDVPVLSRVFLTYPSRARGRTQQRLGRIMRTHPDKVDAVLFDFVDSQVPLLRRHHLERRRLYSQILGARREAVA
jgi:superfamily II DNA or RNA helicase